MISYEEAIAMLDREVKPLGLERVPLDSAAGRQLAEDIEACHDYPRFDNSSVDGFAIHGVEAGNWRVVGSQFAGEAVFDRTLVAGEALRVMTGAPIPAGTEAVLMQEDCTVDGVVVTCGQLPQPGQGIRRRGSDFFEGDMLPLPRSTITPPMLGIMAAAGLTEITVRKRPEIGLVITGLELHPDPRGSQIFDSNGPMLSGLLQHLGYSLSQIRRVEDSPLALKAALSEEISQKQLVVTTGGVSVGEADLVRQVWQELGLRELFWRIAAKPGKPTCMALASSGTVVLGLPGNPLSAMVMMHQFGVRILRHMEGIEPKSEVMQVRLGETVTKQPERMDFMPARLNPLGEAVVLGKRESHLLGGAAMADGLVIGLLGVEEMKAGEIVSYIPFEWTR